MLHSFGASFFIGCQGFIRHKMEYHTANRILGRGRYRMRDQICFVKFVNPMRLERKAKFWLSKNPIAVHLHAHSRLCHRYYSCEAAAIKALRMASTSL